MKTATLAILLFFAAGCAVLNPQADPLVVRAEQTTAIAYDVIDAFLAWEHPRRSQMPPDIHHFAEGLRENAPQWLAEARRMTKLYKQTRNPLMKPDLITALAQLESAMVRANQYLSSTP